MSSSAFNAWTNGRKLKVTGAVIASLGASVGAYYGWGYGSPGGNVPLATVTANLWVNTTAGASPSRCSSPCAYDSTHAYGSFVAAYTAASGGDVVKVKAGTYVAQTITAASKGTTPIAFSKESGTVTIAGLTDNASYVTFDGFTGTATTNVANGGGIGVESTSGVGGLTNVTVTNSSFSVVYIKGSFVTFQHVTVGPMHACLDGNEDGVLIEEYAGSPDTASDHITIDDVTIHDIDRWNDPAVGSGSGTCADHTDGLQMAGGDTVTVKNSHIYRTATDTILARPQSGDVLDHVLIENNMLGSTLEAGNDLIIGDGSVPDSCGTDDITVQDNTLQTIRIGCSGTTAIARDNLIRDGSYVCTGTERNATWTYNTFGSGTTGTCAGGTGAQVCDATFSDASRSTTGNYDLSSSDTCAKNHGDPVTRAALDIHGTTRPLGGTVDIGAHEVG